MLAHVPKSVQITTLIGILVLFVGILVLFYLGKIHNIKLDLLGFKILIS
jgi:hypothetical protein